jgi:hypothetical protein
MFSLWEPSNQNAKVDRPWVLKVFPPAACVSFRVLFMGFGFFFFASPPAKFDSAEMYQNAVALLALGGSVN